MVGRVRLWWWLSDERRRVYSAGSGVNLLLQERMLFP
jgi:hypothetical protein